MDKSSVGNAGNAILSNRSVRRDGADWPKNSAGRKDSSSLIDSSERYVSEENGCSIVAKNEDNSTLVTDLNRMSVTRSRCWSASATLMSSPDGSQGV